MATSAPGCPPDEAIFAWIENALPPAEAELCRVHLENCERCKTLADDAGSLRGISATLRSATLNQRDRERIRHWTEQTLAQLEQVRAADARVGTRR